MTESNLVKGGSTVPLKFQVLQGATVVTDPSITTGFTALPVSCASPGISIGAASAPSATPRYNAEDEHFILNWRVPSTLGCYEATITLSGGATFSALFEVRK
jgi:hypothetical protein